MAEQFIGTKDNIALVYSTMPTAAAAFAGKIVQFSGATDSNYTHGLFYECKLTNSVYVWELVTVSNPPTNNIDYTLIAFIARYFKSATTPIYVNTPTSVSDSETGASDGILSTILSNGSDQCILIPKSSGNVLYTDNFGGTGHTEAVTDGEIVMFNSDDNAIVTVTHYTVSQVLETGLIYITE